MFYRLCSILSMGLIACASTVASAATLYSDDFNTDTSASYNTFITAGAAGGPSGDVTFAYNYGAAPGSGGLAIPSAPHTTDASTLGVRVRTDNLQNAAAAPVVGATELVTKGLSLPNTYRVTVDVWSNYIGGTSLAVSGSNGSTGTAVGIGTAGTSLQYIVSNDGYLAEGFGDGGGGANGDFRVYPNIQSPRPTPANSGYYAAGTGANSATHTDPYYTSFMPSVSAPTAQSTFAASQSGSTPAGAIGFAWHTWTITQDPSSVAWDIDGHRIATVPRSAFTQAGSQIALSNIDTGTGGNTTANNQLFNAQIFDNLKVVDYVPEPGTFVLCLLGMSGLIGFRHRG